MTQNSRISSLDGLRGISICLVLVSHFIHSTGSHDKMALGNLGVRVFFVISGFLITGLLLKELDKTNKISITSFYFRRTLRIFPPFYFFLFVMMLASFWGFVPVRLSDFFYAFFYVTDYVDTGWSLGHSWSLSVEEQFYLLYPFIFILLGRRKIVYLLAAVILIVPIIRYFGFINSPDAIFAFYGFHVNMDALATGCLLAFFRESLHKSRFYSRILTSRIIYLIPVVCIFFNAFNERPRLYTAILTMLNLLVAFSIDWCITNTDSSIFRVLNTKILSWVGVLSYSIYLWQQPFFDYNEHWWTKFPMNFVMMFLCAVFSYYIVEKNSLKFRSYLENRSKKGHTDKLELVSVNQN